MFLPYSSIQQYPGLVAGASIQPSLSPGFDKKFFGFLMIFVARAVQEHSRVTKRYEACDKIGPELRGVTMLKIDMKHLETIEYYRPKHI